MAEERNQEEMMKDIIELQADELLIAGGTLVFIGTLTAALSITNIFLTRSQQGAEGFVLGHVIESTGNVLHVAAKEKQFSIEPIEPRFTGIIGSGTQAVANMGIAATVQAGLPVGLFDLSESENTNNMENSADTKNMENTENRENTNNTENADNTEEDELLEDRILLLYAFFSAIQSIGAYTEGYSIERVPPFEMQQIEATGDYLASLGAAIEIGALSLELAEIELLGILIAVIASWIQFTGSIFGLYSLTTQGAINQQEFDEKYRYSYSRYTT